jgi:hypothetical protein
MKRRMTGLGAADPAGHSNVLKGLAVDKQHEVFLSFHKDSIDARLIKGKCSCGGCRMPASRLLSCLHACLLDYSCLPCLPASVFPSVCCSRSPLPPACSSL